MSDSCELSLEGRAFSTALTAFVGSIVTGVSDGYLVAFFIGWICWLAAVRLVLVSLAGLVVTICGPSFGIRQPFLYASPPATTTDEDHPLTPIFTTGKNGNGNGNGNEDVGAQADMPWASSGQLAQADMPWTSSGQLAEDHPLTPIFITGKNGNGNGNGNGNENEDVGAQADMSWTSSGQLAETPATLPGTEDGGIEVNPAENNTGDIENKIINAPVDRDNADARVSPLSAIFTATNSAILPQRNRDVTILGAIGWIYTLIYTPIIQILWIAANWSPAPSVLFVSRAIGVSVTALSYTIDTRARYGTALGKKFGSEKVVPRLMNFYSALVNTLFSILVVVLLIRALEKSVKSDAASIFKAMVAPYIIFSFIWALGSFKILWPTDEGWNGTSLNGPLTETLVNIFRGVFMGAFAGIFVAAPSIAMWQDAEFAKWGQEHGIPGDPGDDSLTRGQSLGKWLECTTDSWWKKAVQILP